MRFRAIAAIVLAVGCGPAMADDRALLIGIGDYPGLTIGGTPDQLDLEGPPNDLVGMRALLADALGYSPDQIRTLADAQATGAAIVAEIKTWLIDGTKPGDRALLYFSGHGAQVLVPDGQGGTRLTSALVPADARIEITEAITPNDAVILGPQLGALMRQLEGREVTVIADSCYSGSITKGTVEAGFLRGMRTITPRGPLELVGTVPDDALLGESKTSVRLLDFGASAAASADNIAVWSASTIAQVTWDTPEGGLFTRGFIDGLAHRKAAAGADAVNASQLLYYLRSAATAYCERQGGCRDGLTPELLASDAYRASKLVPYEPQAPSEPTPVEPQGPALVDLAIDVLGHPNDFALAAMLLPDATVGLGEEIRIRVDSAESGFLLVLDTGPDGKLRRLFPNDFSDAQDRAGRVAAGRPFTLPDSSYPFALVATDPGPSTLLVLVADSPFDGAELLRLPAFEPVGGPGRALAAIAADLQAPLLDPSPDIDNRARRWSLVRVDYVVTP